MTEKNNINAMIAMEKRHNAEIAGIYEKIKKTAKELIDENSKNDNADDMNLNPYACGVHDGILDLLSKLGIFIDGEDWIN